MRRIFIIARREYLAVVGTKGFLIGIVLMPMLMFGGIFVAKMLERHGNIDDKRVLVFDGTGVLFPALVAVADARNEQRIFDDETGKQIEPRYLLESAPFETLSDKTRLDLSEQIRSKSLNAFVEIPPDALAPGKSADPPSVTTFYADKGQN